MYNRKFTKICQKVTDIYDELIQKFIHTVPKIRLYGDENICEWSWHFWECVNSTLHI